MRSHAWLLGMTLALVVAVVWAHQYADLYSQWVLGLIFLLGIVSALLQWRISSKSIKHALTVFAIMACAFSYTQARALERLQQHIPNAWIGQTHHVTGSISSIPLRTPFGVRFVLQPSHIQDDPVIQKAMNDGSLPSRITTAWYDDDLPTTVLKVGQEWRLPVSFKPPRATQNEGVFDQEQLWWAANLRGMATVRVNQKTLYSDYPKLIVTHHTLATWLHNTRMFALQRIDQVLSAHDSDTAAIFKALTFGEQSDISAAQWNLFQQAGISHLISISGVHITMFAALMAWCVHILWRRSVYLCTLMPSLYAAQWAGLILALVYALFAGWALPAQRTVYMLAIWLLFSRIGVAHSGVRVVCFALWWVLLFDPFAVLQIGFWLSFGAVTWLILAFQYTMAHDEHSYWRRIGVFLASQMAIGIAMLPITFYFFHQASWLGVLINSIAIPLVSIVLVPLMLLACAVQFIWGWSALMIWVGHALAWCINGLEVLVAALPDTLWVKNLLIEQTLVLTILSLLLIWMLQKQSWRMVLLVLSGYVLMFFWPLPKTQIALGQVHVHVLDVGQGSAVLLQTAHQNWLYDTGPHYGNGSDAGARVIVPYLRAQGIERIDTLILSHNDADHTGGVSSVGRAVHVEQILSSMSYQDFQSLNVSYHGAFNLCETNQSINVDGVIMQMLSPMAEVRDDKNVSDNSKSCVLRVDVTTGEWRSMILTGDIDGLREAKLVVAPTGGVQDWSTDVLMAPHHGSGSSSTAPLIEATRPKMAFVQAGYLNPFHHPSPRVLERYHEAGALTEQTIDTGTLRFCLGCQTVNMVKWREIGRQYWWQN